MEIVMTFNELKIFLRKFLISQLRPMCFANKFKLVIQSTPRRLQHKHPLTVQKWFLIESIKKGKVVL